MANEEGVGADGGGEAGDLLRGGRDVVAGLLVNPSNVIHPYICVFVAAAVPASQARQSPSDTVL